MSTNDIWGGYQSQTSRALASIDSTKYPDTNKDFQANIQRLNQFVDYLAEYTGQMQKGVDKANQDFLGKFHDMVTNIGILLGGGDPNVTEIDWGDLQYYLPAIGALLGFDANTPFPINLINAAEHFFLGFVVPLDAWQVAVDDQVDAWAASWGLDEDFVNSLHELIDAFGGVSDSWNSFMQAIGQLFNIFDIDPDNTAWLGPFADLWNSISQLLSGFDLKNLGTVLNPVFHSLAPWIEDLADGIDSLSQIIQAWSGGLTDLHGILNFANMFGNIDFTSPTWTITGAWDAIIAQWFSTSQQFAHTVATVPVPIGNLVNILQDFQIGSGFDSADVVAISETAGWSYDDSVGRMAPGSFKCPANGTLQAAHGNWVSVTPGETINPEAYVLWSGLVGTGTVAELQLTTNSADPTKRYITMATLVSPGASGTWTRLAGSLVVPDGVTQVKARFVVTAAATAGIFWWDDAPNHKGQNLLPQDWIENLTSDLQDLWDDMALAGQGQWNDLLADLGLSDIPGLADWLNDTSAKAIAAQSEFNLFLTTGDWSHLMNSLFGSSSASPGSTINQSAVPTLPQSKVTGVTDINTWLRNIIEDATIVFGDGLHLTYALGSPSDAVDRIWTTPGIGYNKRTYYAAWNRLMQALGWAKSTSAPSVQANDVGGALNTTNLAVGTAQATANGANTGVQAIADGINQAITGTTATGSDKTAAAVKANLTAIPPKNITAQDYGVITFQGQTFTMPPGASIFLPPNIVTQAQANGDSIGANTTQGLWLAKPGLYAIQTICTFTATAGFALNGAVTPTLVYGDTLPPNSGTWTGSLTLPIGTSATIVDSSTTYTICGDNNYVRTDTGNRWFLPGVRFTSSGSTSGKFNLGALAMIVVKLSN